MYVRIIYMYITKVKLLTIDRKIRKSNVPEGKLTGTMKQTNRDRVIESESERERRGENSLSKKKKKDMFLITEIRNKKYIETKQNNMHRKKKQNECQME